MRHLPENESAQVSGVKAVSNDDLVMHLKAIEEHRKAIDLHQRGMRMHIKSLLDLADDDDDEPLLEDDDGDEKALFLAELKQLAEQATALTTT